MCRRMLKDQSWRNESWTPGLSWVFARLSPGSRYRFGVYVRLARNHSHVSRPLEYVVAATLSAGEFRPTRLLAGVRRGWGASRVYSIRRNGAALSLKTLRKHCDFCTRTGLNIDRFTERG